MLALGGVAERIERRAAQELQLRQQLEGRQHPRAELLLQQVAGLGIAAGEQRRGEVELQPEVALELPLELRAAKAASA